MRDGVYSLRRSNRFTGACDHVVSILFSFLRSAGNQCESKERGQHVRVWEPCRQDELHGSSHVELCLHVLTEMANRELQ